MTDVASANAACRRLRPALGTFVSVRAVADAVRNRSSARWPQRSIVSQSCNG